MPDPRGVGFPQTGNKLIQIKPQITLIKLSPKQ